jgi:MOSC domain-containing protein YiiM
MCTETSNKSDIKLHNICKDCLLLFGIAILKEYSTGHACIQSNSYVNLERFYRLWEREDKTQWMCGVLHGKNVRGGHKERELAHRQLLVQLVHLLLSLSQRSKRLESTVCTRTARLSKQLNCGQHIHK